MYDKQTVYAAAGTSTYVFADAVLQQIISMASSLSEGVMVLTDSTKASGTDYYNSLEFTLWSAVKLTITDTGTAGSTVNLTVKVTVNETEINAGYVPVALSTGGSIRKCIVRMGISTNHDAVVLRLTKQSSDYICLDTIIAKNGNVYIVSTDSTTGTPTATPELPVVLPHEQHRQLAEVQRHRRDHRDAERRGEELSQRLPVPLPGLERRGV